MLLQVNYAARFLLRTAGNVKGQFAQRNFRPGQQRHPPLQSFFKIEFLMTAHSTMESRNSVRPFFWTSISQACGLMLRLGSNLLLTRLLAPEAFALVGTALAFLTTLEWLSDLGIQPAILRHSRAEDIDVLSTGWWLGLYRGAGLTAIAALSAVPLASFYAQPELAGVLFFLSLRPVLMCLRSPAMPLLRRRLQYHSVFIDELTMTVSGTAVSIAVACFLPSVWAIVAGTMAGAVSGIVISYVLCPVLPGKSCSEVRRDLWGFGSRILLNTFVMAAWMNIDRLFGLKLVSAHEMGLYAVAWNLAAAVEAMIHRGCDVHFSMLSRESNGKDQDQAHAIAMQRVTRWVIPSLALAVCFAPSVIRFLYDERYSGAQSIFTILMCRVLVRGIGQMEFQYLLARNEIRIGTLSYLVALLVQLMAIVPFSSQWGATGLAYSALLSTTTVTCVQAVLSSRRVGVSTRPVVAGIAWLLVPVGLLQISYMYG